MTNSLWPHEPQPARLLCPWDSPGKNTGVVAIPFSRGSSRPRDRTTISCNSCTGRQILHHWANWKAHLLQFSSVQLLSHVRLFATPWITARQASLSITNSRSSLRLRSIESVMPSSYLNLCCPLLLLPQSLPASESFPVSQLFAWDSQSIGVSALATVLPMNTQDWSPLERTGWISLQSKGLSRVFSNTTVQKHQFFGAQPSSQSNSHIHTWALETP